MKISKLFHWLYALVMLLPIFAIGVTCGYAIFNKNANKSYNETYITDVNSLNNFDYGQEYYFKNLDTTITGNIGESTSRIWTYDFTYNGTNYGNVTFWYYGSNNNITLWAKNTDTNTSILENGVLTQISFKFKYLRNSLNENTFNLIKSTLKRINTRTIDNVFYYSIDKVTQSNLFNWAYDSFLVTPFAYIVNLFSMPTNSPIVMLLSYWLAISIIWLVFDLIMYVPLLIHRWLDKGVLE